MMKKTTWAWGLAPVLLATAFGCGGNSPAVSSPTGGDVATAETAGPTEEDESTADLHEHHRHHHHGGLAMFIAMSLDSLNVTPEQAEKIKAIQQELHQKLQPAHDAERNVLNVLADGIAAGNINPATVDAAVEELSTTAASVHESVADALNQLHATLTPEQRAALVDKLEAHFEVWWRENQPEEQPDHKGGPLAHLAKELNLTADQVATVRSGFKSRVAGGKHHFDRAEADEHLKAFGAAFIGDGFDAHAMKNGGPVNAHMAAWGVRRMAHLYEAVTPVLTPEQRTQLSQMVRRHANYKRTESGT